MWRQGMYVLPFMARLGVTTSWSGWSATGTGALHLPYWNVCSEVWIAVVERCLSPPPCLGHLVRTYLTSAIDSPKLFGIHLTGPGYGIRTGGVASTQRPSLSPGDWLPAEYSPWSLIGQFAGSMPTVQAVLWHTILLLACLVCSLASSI